MKTPLDLSKASIYEQLAEEAVELAHAAQKMSRILRDENPTPLTLEFVEHSVFEEFNDILLVADLIGLCPDQEFQRGKLTRWINRLND